MRGRLGEVDLRAAAPHHHEALERVLFLELSDVFSKLIGEISLVASLFDVRSVEALHVLPIEHGRPGADLFELRTDLIEEIRSEHAGSLRRFIRVVFENVPAAEHHVVERCERHEVPDERGTRFGTLPETHGAHLRERSDRLRETPPDGQHAGDRRRAYRPHADEHDAQLPTRAVDTYWDISLGFCVIFHNSALYHRSCATRRAASRVLVQRTPLPRTAAAATDTSCQWPG
jgi:hypothetical protein